MSVEWIASAKPEEFERWLADVARLTEKGALPVAANERPRYPYPPDVTAARFPVNEVVSGGMLGLKPTISDSQGVGGRLRSAG